MDKINNLEDCRSKLEEARKGLEQAKLALESGDAEAAEDIISQTIGVLGPR